MVENTSSGRLLRRNLDGQVDVVLDGLVWITLASPKDSAVEWLMSAPMPVRRAAGKLPDPLQPKPKRTARVIAVFELSGGSD